MTQLFQPFRLRKLEFRNRIFVSPMCMYSARGGMPQAWHLVHLGARAVGGAGGVIVEATGVCPEGRITPGDLGLWNDRQAKAFLPITRFIREQGAVPGIQLAHAGRKASTAAPWVGGAPLSKKKGGWTVVAPSAKEFGPGYPTPRAMTLKDIDRVVKCFESATRRSFRAGFQFVEIHMAHGYLLNEFFSPLANERDDEYGGSLENRMRLPLRVAKTVRKAWPSKLPVFVRLSATDWMDGGVDIAQTLELVRRLKEIGIDLIDTSTGGMVPDATIPAAPGFQAHFAETIRRETGIATGAVGIITTGQQAEAILNESKADVIIVGREFLRDPYFPLHAAKELGMDVAWPAQYLRAKR